jgi:[acyl-carrier-protein] S-malonyltransferase
LGVFTHLGQLGALSAACADAIVAARGACSDAGPRGAMAAVQPVAIADVEPVIRRIRGQLGLDASELDVSNDNSPKQVVIAGRADAVRAACTAIADELYAITTIIDDQIPMHVGRFRPAAMALRPVLEAASWSLPTATWWSNVEGGPIADVTQARMVQLMVRHVYERVRWRSLVDGLVARHPNAVFVEVGPRTVLTGLFARGRWHPDVSAFALDVGSEAGGRGGADVFAERIEEVRRAVG